MTYPIKAHVAQQIAHLSQEDLAVVQRCIYNYSKPNCFGYRLKEWHNSYPDWNRSVEILDKREFKTIPGKGNPVNTIGANIIFAPFAALDYMLQESGTASLKRLIKENS